MALFEDIPVPCRIIALVQEQNRLFAFPLKDLAYGIQATGFQCDCCGKCCTKEVNGHIFLLDHDVTELIKIDPTAYEPAPEPEFCDQNGMLYVSGYALRMKNDSPGSCWFLENRKCRIYDHRFSGCRIYPHMLRRSADASGRVDWREFAHKKEHGWYDQPLSYEMCLEIAQEIKGYENAFLTQQISFLETMYDYFTAHNLKHDPEMFKLRMQQCARGIPIGIKVFHAGELEEFRTSKTERFR